MKLILIILCAVVWIMIVRLHFSPSALDNKKINLYQKDCFFTYIQKCTRRVRQPPKLQPGFIKELVYDYNVNLSTAGKILSIIEQEFPQSWDKKQAEEIVATFIFHLWDKKLTYPNNLVKIIDQTCKISGDNIRQLRFNFDSIAEYIIKPLSHPDIDLNQSLSSIISVSLIDTSGNPEKFRENLKFMGGLGLELYKQGVNSGYIFSDILPWLSKLASKAQIKSGVGFLQSEYVSKMKEFVLSLAKQEVYSDELIKSCIKAAFGHQGKFPKKFYNNLSSIKAVLEKLNSKYLISNSVMRKVITQIGPISKSDSEIFRKNLESIKFLGNKLNKFDINPDIVLISLVKTSILNADRNPKQFRKNISNIGERIGKFGYALHKKNLSNSLIQMGVKKAIQFEDIKLTDFFGNINAIQDLANKINPSVGYSSDTFKQSINIGYELSNQTPYRFRRNTKAISELAWFLIKHNLNTNRILENILVSAQHNAYNAYDKAHQFRKNIESIRVTITHLEQDEIDPSKILSTMLSQADSVSEHNGQDFRKNLSAIEAFVKKVSQMDIAPSQLLQPVCIKIIKLAKKSLQDKIGANFRKYLKATESLITSFYHQDIFFKDIIDFSLTKIIQNVEDIPSDFFENLNYIKYFGSFLNKNSSFSVAMFKNSLNSSSSLAKQSSDKFIKNLDSILNLVKVINTIQSGTDEFILQSISISKSLANQDSQTFRKNMKAFQYLIESFNNLNISPNYIDLSDRIKEITETVKNNIESEDEIPDAFRLYLHNIQQFIPNIVKQNIYTDALLDFTLSKISNFIEEIEDSRDNLRLVEKFISRLSYKYEFSQKLFEYCLVTSAELAGDNPIILRENIKAIDLLVSVLNWAKINPNYILRPLVQAAQLVSEHYPMEFRRNLEAIKIFIQGSKKYELALEKQEVELLDVLENKVLEIAWEAEEPKQFRGKLRVLLEELINP